MTGSKKLIGMLNRYVHCVSYTKTEELETELMFYFHIRFKDFTSWPGTGLFINSWYSFDNFDQFAETLSVKNTLHDTVGIVYQSASEETSRAAANALQNRPSASGDSTSRRKRRRTFQSFGVDIEPYHKKPQALIWCCWDIQINNGFLRVTDWQKSAIYCGWFSSAFSQSLLRCGLVVMHSIELTRKRQKWYGIFRLSINHQHRQQLLKKQWKVHNKWPLNVENVKLLWPTI